MKDLIRVWTFIGLGLLAMITYGWLLQYRAGERYAAAGTAADPPIVPEETVEGPEERLPVDPEPEPVPIPTETPPDKSAPDVVTPAEPETDKETAPATKPAEGQETAQTSPEPPPAPVEETAPPMPVEQPKPEEETRPEAADAAKPEPEPEMEAAPPPEPKTVPTADWETRQDMQLCPPFPDNTDWTWTTPEKGDGLILAPDKEGLVRLVTAARVVRSHQTPDGLTSLYLITEDNRFRLTYTGLAEVTIEAGAELACGEAVGSTRPSGMRFSVHKIADASVWWEGEPVETLTFLAKSDKSQ